MDEHFYNSIMWAHLFCAWVQKTCLIAFDNKSKCDFITILFLNEQNLKHLL